MIHGDVEFFGELMELYRIHNRKIRKALRIRSEKELVDFCTDFRQLKSWNDEERIVKREHICKLALVFSNILGSRLPDHIHARMILGPANQSCKEYIEYVRGLKPKAMLGLMNPNPNNFRMHTLSVNGTLSKLTWK